MAKTYFPTTQQDMAKIAKQAGQILEEVKAMVEGLKGCNHPDPFVTKLSPTIRNQLKSVLKNVSQSVSVVKEQVTAWESDEENPYAEHMGEAATRVKKPKK